MRDCKLTGIRGQALKSPRRFVASRISGDVGRGLLSVVVG
jgi:hypothetical protein